MGTGERKQRQREERETLFLDKAAELIEAEGLVNLQMARLASACDYATGTLYQHFSSKEDLLAALANRNAQAHVTMFERVGAWRANPRDRMFAICVADQEFAQRNASQFRLVQYVFTEAVWENTSAERRQQILQCSGPIGAVVSGIVREAVDAGDLPASDLNPLELALGPWCLSEGMHNVMHTRGLLEALAIRGTHMLLYRHIHALLNGMGWQPLLDHADTGAIETLVKRIQAEVLLTPSDTMGP